MKKTIFNCSVDDFTLDQAVKKIESNLAHKVKTFQVSLNTDSVVRANENPEYASVLKKANIITIDGMPLIFLSKFLNNQIKHRVTGPDIFYRLLKIANNKKLKVYFLGATDKVIKKLKNNIIRKYPDIIITGAKNGYFKSSRESKIVSEIARSESDILFLALGAPKQDEFIAKYLDRLNVTYATGVGGCFDIFTGEKKRAPIFLQNIGLEWFFRFIQEPKRLFRRYFVTDIKIFSLLVREVYLNIFKSGHKRSQLIKQNIAVSLALQVASVFLSLLMVPIALRFVGTTNYGIFLTIASFIAWFALLDFGFSQGLKNNLSEAFSRKDISSARSYVSSAYTGIITIFALIYIMFFIANHYIDWANIIGVSESYLPEIRYLMNFIFAGFCLQLVLNLLNTITSANQKPAYSSLFSFVSSALTLIVLIILSKTTEGTLLKYGLTVIFSPVITYTFFTLFMFKKKYRLIVPSLAFIKTKYLKKLLNIGLKFFIIQLSMIVIFQTDYLIISRLFGPNEVVAYNIAYKYFALTTTVFAIIIAPFWSAATDAYVKKDFKWMQNAVKKLNKSFLIFATIGILMLIISPWFYNFWLKGAVHVPIKLSIAMFIYSQLLNWGSIYVVFINGTGKVKIQLIIGIIGAIVNIPLSIFFAKTLGIGATGVIIATIICIFYGYAIAPYQFKKLVAGKL